MVRPCMGMADCGYEANFPNLLQTPLKVILCIGSDFVRLENTTVGEIRDHNPKCRTCPYVDRCTGGCRNSVLMAGDDYYGIDPECAGSSRAVARTGSGTRLRHPLRPISGAPPAKQKPGLSTPDDRNSCP